MRNEPVRMDASSAIGELLAPDRGIEDMARRHEAFFGPLDPVRRRAAAIAMDFFCFINEANRQLWIARTDTDEIDRLAAYALALEYATVALATFRRFGGMLCCGDLAETVEKLDRLVDHAEKCCWTITPPWWRKVPGKTTAYFVGQLKIYAAKRDSAIIAALKAEAEKKKAKRKAAPDPAKEGGAA